MPRDDRYLWHLTTTTGHGRRSYRSEVDDAHVTIVGHQLAEAMAAGSVEIRPGYRLRPTAAESALVATVQSDAGYPLATIAVAPDSKRGAKLWALLRETDFDAKGDAPRPPWCAVRLHPALAGDLGAAPWIGDYGRLLAWAWIERAAYMTPT